MTYAPAPGDTLLIPSGPNGLHLFIIVTKQCPNNSFLMFSVSRIKHDRYHDPTCVFEGGEHSFITDPSYVVYSKAEQRFIQAIQKCVNEKVYVPKEILDQEYLARICAGIGASERTKPWARDHYNRHK